LSAGRTKTGVENSSVTDDPAKKIAVVQRAPSAVLQDVFRMLLDRWRPFVRVAGVTAEGHGLADRACDAGFLRNIGTGERFPIFQNLDPGSAGCHLEADGVLRAAAAALRPQPACLDVSLDAKEEPCTQVAAGIPGNTKERFLYAARLSRFRAS
jgi:hypothetical protein